MKRLLIALGFSIAAIVVAASIAGPLYEHIANGGSSWWQAAFFIPLIIAVTGISIAAKGEHRDQALDVQQAPTARQWHVWDEELPPELSPTERGMVNRNGLLDAAWPDVERLWREPWREHPLNGLRPAPTRDQKDLAAEHAAEKRYYDGLGDV